MPPAAIRSERTIVATKKTAKKKSASKKKAPRAKTTKSTKRAAPKKTAKRKAASAKPAKPKTAKKTAKAAKTTKVAKAAKKRVAKAATKSTASPKGAPRTKGASKPTLRLTTAANHKHQLPPVSEIDLEPPKGRVSSGLTKRDLEKFRQLLLLKRAEILGDMNTLQNEAFSVDGRSDLSSMPIHMADLGTDNYEQEFTLRLLQDENGVLREINEALKRIEKRTYGICEATGRPIGKARLEAQPWARFCYEYSLLQEQRRGRF